MAWVGDPEVEMLAVLLNLEDEVAGRRGVVGVVAEAVALKVSSSVIGDLLRVNKLMYLNQSYRHLTRTEESM